MATYKVIGYQIVELDLSYFLGQGKRQSANLLITLFYSEKRYSTFDYLSTLIFADVEKP